MPTPPPLQGILETAVYVDDLEKAHAFYAGVIGLKRMVGGDRLCAYDAGPGETLLVFARGQTIEDTVTDGGVIPAGLRRLEVVFTSPVDANLVDSRNFSVTRAGQQLALADEEFLYDIDSLTVSLPPIDFEPGALYEARVRPSLLGSLAADRPPPRPWRFTTETPAVVGTEPEAGAEGVALSTATIQILFSGRIASRDETGFQLASRSLAEVGFRSVPELMATFAAKKPEIDPWLDDAEVTRDRNLRLQYLAGMGVNLYEADAIYRDMARYRTYPEGLFTGSPYSLSMLQAAWNSMQ